MANKGDVDLVIRAKNEAGRTLDAVSKALDQLSQKQTEAGSSANTAGNLLSAFAKTLGVVSKAYDSLQSDADKAGAAVERQQSILSENKAAYAALTAQMEAAARVQQRMAAFVGPRQPQAQKDAAAQLSVVEKAQSAMAAQADRLAKSIATQTDALQAAQSGLIAISASADQAASELARVEAGHKEAAAAAEKEAAASRDAAAAAAAEAQAQDALAAAQKRATQQRLEAAKQAAEAAAQQKQLVAQQEADARAAAARSAERAAILDARRNAFGTRTDLRSTIDTAQAGQANAQSQIAALQSSISATGGQATSDQAAQMAKLITYAGAYKAALQELRVANEQYNRTLRDTSASAEQIAAAQQRARAAIAGVTNSFQEVTSASKQSTAASREAAASRQEEVDSNKKLDNALQSLFANSRRSLSLYQRIRGEVLALTSTYVGLYAAINGINQVIQASMQFQATESRLNVVTGGDPAKTGAEMQWLIKQADALGFSINVLGQEWSKFAVASQASNFTMAETRKIFMSVATAGRVLKLDSTNLQQSFLAITQMMSKGTIQMEELRQQLGEHIPGAFALMAKAAGVGAADLQKMMEKGQLTSDYLLKFADVLDDKFGGQLSKSLNTTQAEIGRFQTALTVALNEIADAGVLDAFTAAIKRLREMLRSDDAAVWFQRIGSAVGGVIKFLLALLDNLDLIMAAFVALGTAKGVGYVIALTQALIRMITTIRAAQTAGAALSVTMAGLAGPIGIGIGLLAGAFAYLATKVSDSEKAMVSAQRTVDDISASYRAAAANSKDWADTVQKMSQTQADATSSALKKKLQDQLGTLGNAINNTVVDEFGRTIEIPISKPMQQIKDLLGQVQIGAITIDDFKKRLDAIGEANPDLKSFIVQLQDQADEANKTKTALDKFQAAMRLVSGTASDADKKLLGMNTALDDNADSANAAANALERYKTALQGIQKEVPELKKSIELEQNIATIQRTLDSNLKTIAADPNLDKDTKLRLSQQFQDSAARAITAVKQQYEEALISQFGNEHGNAMLQSVDLIKQREGFRASAYVDSDGRYRVGYGSDQTTAANGAIGRVTADTTTTETDALRDLVRRIGEFQEAIKARVGADRYNALTAPQQAALTDIAYNYGSLPKNIADAVKNGTTETIAAAIRSRAGDNRGVNSGRREQEAQAFDGAAPGIDALNQKQAQQSADRVTKVITDLVQQMTVAAVPAREKFIEDAVKKAQPEDPNVPRLNEKQVQQVRDQAGATFDSQQSVLVQQKILDLQRQLAESRSGMTKNEFIANEAQKQKIDLLTTEGKKWAQLQGQVYDRENAEKSVNELMAVREQLITQLANQQNQGDATGAAATQTALDGVNARLQEAIQSATAFWQTMSPSTNPLAQSALLNLQNMQTTLQKGTKTTIDAKSINDQFTSGAVQGFDAMAESVAGWIDGTKSGDDVLKDLGRTFLKFASDFLMNIAKMILQQAIFNAISGGTAGTSGGGGLGGLISAGLGGLFGSVGGASAGAGLGSLGGSLASAAVLHTGGVAGSQGTMQRTTSLSLFTNAMRYHTGGIAGLDPNEVPAVLQAGEEVLTRNDPRHIMNGGGSGGSARAPKIVNVLDPSIVGDYLNSSSGEEVHLNVIKRNASQIKQILSES